MPDTENVLKQVEDAVDQLSGLLDKAEVKAAISAIPDSIMNPVIDGLKSVLEVIKDALNELKNSLGSVTSLGDLFTIVNNLLAVVEGLAPGQKDTLETVKTIIKTLQDLPGAADIDRILGKIDALVNKLAAL